MKRTRPPVMRRAPGLLLYATAMCAVTTFATACTDAPAEPLTIAAASDLMPAFTQLAKDVEEAGGGEVTLNFGSSGLLAQQLLEGAPMDVYASADAAFVDRVLDAGIGDPATRHTYALGRIALWAADDRWDGWTSLPAVAEDGSIETVAIANPEHAPYGRAAREALDATGTWEELGPRIVYGENISDAHRLAASGNADVVVTALSLALASGDEGAWHLLDTGLHAPLRQDLVVTTDDPAREPAAQRFIDHVRSDEGRAVMRRWGFVAPGDPPPESWER